MREDAFRAWLNLRYKREVAASRMSNVRTVEKRYGDVDAQYDADQFETLLAKLQYSSRDETIVRPNPTDIPINGNIRNGLATLRNALGLYREFRSEAGETLEPEATSGAARVDGQQFALEAHLQEALRAEIGQIEPGLQIEDGGAEYAVASGMIDILARDDQGSLVVIELKRGTAKRDAVGQVLGYMGDLISTSEERLVRGIIVAADFDKGCLGAIRAVPNLQLKRYRYRFSFEHVTP